LICATISEIFDNQGGDRDLMVLPIKKYRNIWKVVFLAANNRRILLAAKNTPAPDKPNILWVIRPSNPPYKVAARGVMLFFGFVPRGTAKRAPVTSIEKRFGLDNSSSRGLAHLVVAALPKIPVCALKIGDRTSTTDVTRGSCTGFRRARSFRVWGLGGRVEEGAHEDEPLWFLVIFVHGCGCNLGNFWNLVNDPFPAKTHKIKNMEMEMAEIQYLYGRIDSRNYH